MHCLECCTVFCKHRIALTCDVERMFHRFHVSPRDWDFLRFHGWENRDTKTKPKEYCMQLQIFGASSSPGFANYGFWYLASKYKKDYPMAAVFIQRNFYGNDRLIGVDSIKEAKQLIREAKEIWAKGHLRLHKFVSNNKEVLENKQDCTTKEVDLNYHILPTHSVLSVKWNTDTYTFSFNIALEAGVATRHGILSMMPTCMICWDLSHPIS